MRSTPGFHPIKLFWSLFTHSFCNAGRFSNEKLFSAPLKWSSLQEHKINLLQMHDQVL
jgi:hypothetical protein